MLMPATVLLIGGAAAWFVWAGPWGIEPDRHALQAEATALPELRRPTAEHVAMPDPAPAVGPGEAAATNDEDAFPLPTELHGPPKRDPIDAGWSSLPVAPNLADWIAQAERDPEAMGRLLGRLSQCVHLRMSSIEHVVELWRLNVARAGARAPAGSAPDQRALERFANDARREIESIRHCEGVPDLMTLYMQWLERAAREHPVQDHRTQWRLRFINDPFVDMPSPAQRIGAIDEVLRRRDLAIAWLIELRDRGHTDAIAAYATARSGWTGLLEKNSMEQSAWGFVARVRRAVDLESHGRPTINPHQRSAAELWQTPPESRFPETLSPEQLGEAHRRGRDIYLRLFGAPPA
jgi:hypothetical protein